MRCSTLREWVREIAAAPTPRKIAEYLRGELEALDAEPDPEGESPRRRHLRRCERCRAHVRRTLQYWSLLALFCRDLTPGAGFEAEVARRLGPRVPPARRTGAKAVPGLRVPGGGAPVPTDEERRLYRDAATESAVVGWVVPLTGDDAGLDRPLALGENVLGSDHRLCDVAVDGPGVLGRHASIVCAASVTGLACFLLAHEPGTVWVNGAERPQAWARLEDGDVLRLGGARLKFKALAGVPAG